MLKAASQQNIKNQKNGHSKSNEGNPPGATNQREGSGAAGVLLGQGQKDRVQVRNIFCCWM